MDISKGKQYDFQGQVVHKEHFYKFFGKCWVIFFKPRSFLFAIAIAISYLNSSSTEGVICEKFIWSIWK